MEQNTKDETLWPGWLLTGAPLLREHLKAIEASHARYYAIVEKGFTYRHVPQAQVNSVLDAMMSSGAMKRLSDGKVVKSVKGKINVPKDWEKAFIYDQGTTYRLHRQFIFINQTAVVKLIGAFKRGLSAGDFLVPIICLRGILEHFAHFAETMTFVRDEPEFEKYTPNLDSLPKIREWLSQKTYGTRLDWAAFIGNTSDKIPNKKAIEYKPEENRVNRKASSILNAIDALDKRVAGTRVIYELLCEFAHPNVGTMFASATRCEILPKDDASVIWIEKSLGLDSPQEFLKSFGPSLEKIFNLITRCFSEYDSLVTEGDMLSDKLLRMTQLAIRYAIAHRPDLFESYAICPCGTGRKIKFCCGK